MARLKKAQIDEIRLVGRMMSNILYNLKQKSEIREDWRKSMAETQERWDAIWRGAAPVAPKEVEEE